MHNIGQNQAPGAVGVPVSASMAIVDPKTLRPLPFGREGEIAISGQTVFNGYKDNPEANDQSRFLLESPQHGKFNRWFLDDPTSHIVKEWFL